MRYACVLFLFWATANIAVAQQNFRPFRLVVMGSSTAAGAGAKPADSSWVNRYETFLKSLHPGNQVINLSKRGYSSYRFLPTGTQPVPNRPPVDTLLNITRALALFPDAIIVSLPSNDIAAGFSIQEMLANFEIIAEAASKNNVPIWFSTPLPRNLEPDKIQLQFMVRDSVLQRFRGRAINFWNDIATTDGHLEQRFNAGDGIHLNNAGHQLLFQRVRSNSITGAALAWIRKQYQVDKIWSQPIPLNLYTTRKPPPKHKAASPERGTFLLHADRPIEGATVEIFNSNGKLVRKGVYNLPAVIKTDFGPKGVYSIKIKSTAFQQTKKWIKTD